jgi:hypothetical protein
MSATARLALTVVCWLVALVAEVCALVLLAREWRAVSRALRRWRNLRRAGGEQPAGLDDLDGLVDHLLDNPFDRSAAVVLLVVGVVVGTVGNILSL